MLSLCPALYQVFDPYLLSRRVGSLLILTQIPTQVFLTPEKSLSLSSVSRCWVWYPVISCPWWRWSTEGTAVWRGKGMQIFQTWLLESLTHCIDGNSSALALGFCFHLPVASFTGTYSSQAVPPSLGAWRKVEGRMGSPVSLSSSLGSFFLSLS